MDKKKLVVFLFVFLNCGILFPQNKDFKLETGFTAGMDFDKSKPVITVSFGAELIKNFSFGIKMGGRDYEDNLNDLLYDDINSFYPGLSLGSYSLDAVLVKQTPTYLAAIYSSFKLNDIFEIVGSAGVKFYQDKTYSINDFYFAKSSTTAPLEIQKIQYTNDPTFLRRKDILKGYFSLGGNLRLKTLNVGVVFDNLFSLSINLGKEF